VRRLAVFLAVGVVGVACTAPPVTTEELVGVWRVTDESRSRLLAPFRSVATELALAEAGEFSASELPGEVLYIPPNALKHPLVTGAGQWRLTEQSGRKQVMLIFTELTVGRPGGLPYATYLNVSRSGGNPVLFYFQGDADDGVKIKFELVK
jgi:hypothetical protein